MKIAFLFAGQGSQYVGMGQDFYQEHEEVKKIYDDINLDFNLKDICFNGPKDVLDDTAYSQACILATSMALAKVVTSKGIKPSAVAGLSLGEYSALCFSEVMDIDSGLTIVRERGKIMANALINKDTGMRAVLGLEVDVILAVLATFHNQGVIEIANYNCPGQIVITGENSLLDKASELLLAKGARRVLSLNVSGAFHSSLLDNASIELNKVLKGYSFNEAKYPVYYNITGKREDEAIISILTKQIKSSVYFMQTIENMINDGIDTFIEIGPGTTLSSFVRKVNRDVKVYSINNVVDLDKLVEEIQ